MVLLWRWLTGDEDRNRSVTVGHLVGDDTAVAAVSGEAWENVGEAFESADLRVVGLIHAPGKGGRGHDERVAVLLEAKRWNGRVTNREPEPCDPVRWTERPRLPANVIPHARRAMLLTNEREQNRFDTFGRG
jgi:hypothetical protein